MERKFESELGKRVAEGSWKKASKKSAILAVALSACALMISSAAFMAPAIAGEEYGKPVYWDDVISAQSDYLVYEDGALVHYAEDQIGEDDLFDVKRTVTLKAATFDSPSEFSIAQYNKFVYSVNVNLRDLTYFNPDGTVVGMVTIPYTGTSEPVVSWSMTDGETIVATSEDALPAYVPTETTVANGAITAVVTLPEGYAYDSGMQIGIQLMIKVPLYTESPLGLEIVEDAFPDYDDFVPPVEPL